MHELVSFLSDDRLFSLIKVYYNWKKICKSEEGKLYSYEIKKGRKLRTDENYPHLKLRKI